MVVTLRTAADNASKTCIKLHHFFHGTRIPRATRMHNEGSRQGGFRKFLRGGRGLEGRFGWEKGLFVCRVFRWRNGSL